MRKACITLQIMCALTILPVDAGLIVGTPTASGPGNGGSIPGFILPPSPTIGIWFITNLDFIAPEPIRLSINTDSYPGAVTYTVNANISNSTGGTLDSILIELEGETDGLSFTDPLFDGNQTAGSNLNDRAFIFENLDLADTAADVSSWKLNIGPNLPAQSFDLVITPIPEPSTALLLLACSACLARRRYRSLPIR